jgi:hypothetical protein
MTFVFPILLGGLALAGIPILLHLILRQKPKTLPFPAFRFLVQKHRTNLRKLQLRHLLLLALRVLLIVALCLALARPKFFHESLNLSSDRPVAAILIFDTSPSMDYRSTDQVSRLKEAKDRGLELIEQLPDGSRLLIIDSAEPNLSDRAEWLTSPHQARQQISNLKIRPASAPVTRSIEQAVRQFALLAGGGDERDARLPRLLCVFSDRTRAAWPGERRAAVIEQIDQLPATVEGLQQLRSAATPLIEALKTVREDLPPPAGVDYGEETLIDAVATLRDRAGTLEPKDLRDEAVHGAVRQARAQTRRLLGELAKAGEGKAPEPGSAAANLIANLHGLQRQLAGMQALLLDVGVDNPVDLAILRAEFPHAPGGEMRQLFAGDEKIVLSVVLQALGKDISTGVECRVGKQVLKKDVDLPAGQRVTAPFELDLAGLKLGVGAHTLEVRLTSKDSLESNNQRFAALQIRAPKRVLVLADAKAKAEKFARGLELLGYTGEIKSPAEAPQLDLGKYEAVYLFGLAAPGAALWNAVGAYVQKGGGVAIVPGGEEMQPGAYAQAAALTVMPGTWKEVVTKDDKKDEEKPGAVWKLDEEHIFQHPLMKRYRRWIDNPSTDFVITKPWAHRFWRVEPEKAAVLVAYAEEQEAPAILERLGVPGKVLLLTTPLDDRKPRWNNYGENISSFYLALMSLMTAYLTGEDKGVQLNFDAGQTPRLPLPASSRYPMYTLRGADLFETFSAENAAHELRLKEASQPGNYEVQGVPASGQDGELIARFSVNLPTDEVDLTRAAATDVEAMLGPDAIVAADRRLSVRELLAGHWNEPLELFPYLMVLLLFVLALENLLANKFYRREDV